MGFIVGFTAFFGVVLIYLVVITFFPVLKVKQIPVQIGGGDAGAPAERTDVAFTVGGAEVRGWFYAPQDESGPLPCVVLCHGLNGTKDMRLEQYALKFTEIGWAALAIDYRHYGESGGEPRQIYHAKKQIEDQRAAVEYVRQRSDIDPDKIVLWGTSASGLYGICTAAEDHRISGVIAQCATLDHKADSKPHLDRLGYGFFFRVFVHGQRDKARSRFNLAPHVIPAYSSNGEIALVSAPGLVEGISRLAESSSHFRNEVCARSLLVPHPPDPIAAAENVSCPVLILVCERDEIVSADSHVRVADALKEKADVRSYPIGHFDVYFGEHFERAVKDMTEFLTHKCR